MNDDSKTEIIAKNLISYHPIKDARGDLIAIEEGTHVPFVIRRVYFLKNLNDMPRGFHAHKELQQVLICIKGSCEVMLDDGNQKNKVQVKEDGPALLIGKKIWHEMESFSKDCVIAVFASELYQESDYIRDYEEFKRYI